MATITEQPRGYRFRPGALDAIARTRNLITEGQLAAAIGVRPEDVPKMRAGMPVSARVALKVAAMQGDEDYLAGWFEPFHPNQQAA